MPIVTVKANMAFRSLYSMDETVSWLCFIIRYVFHKDFGKLTLAIKTTPPAIRQKAVISSDGGREGSKDVGGDR